MSLGRVYLGHAVNVPGFLFGAQPLTALAYCFRAPSLMTAKRLHCSIVNLLNWRISVLSLRCSRLWVNDLPPNFLVKSGHIATRVLMVADGSIEVRRNDMPVRTIKRGDFVGETTSLSKQPMSTDIVINEPVRFVSWSNDALEDFMGDQPQIGAAMQKEFGACLARKLNAAT